MACAIASVPAMGADTEAKKDFWWLEARWASKSPSRVTGWFERELTDSIGLYILAEKESGGYQQFYAGPTWKHGDVLKVGAGLGRETVRDEFTADRMNAFFDLNIEKLSVSGTFENGRSGRWHRITAVYTPAKQLGFGLMKESDLGFGPRLQYNIPETKVQAWGALLHDHTGTKLALGMNVSF